jgi:hypothetical protein
VCGYPEIFAPLAISTTLGQACGQAAYLCSAAPGVARVALGLDGAQVLEPGRGRGMDLDGEVACAAGLLAGALLAGVNVVMSVTRRMRVSASSGADARTTTGGWRRER